MEGVRPQRYPTASGLTATGEPHTFGALLKANPHGPALPASHADTLDLDCLSSSAVARDDAVSAWQAVAL